MIAALFAAIVGFESGLVNTATSFRRSPGDPPKLDPARPESNEILTKLDSGFRRNDGT